MGTVVPSMRVVSIIIPTLNEDLTKPVRAIGEYLVQLQRYRFEIIVADDSRDDLQTRSHAEIGCAHLPRNVSAKLVKGPRAGKGAAVQRGIRVSCGDFVLLIDIDFPAQMQCIEEFLGLLEEGADVVIAERVLDRAFSNAARWILSRGLLLIQRAAVFHSSEFRDTQCGFKAFQGEFIRAIASQQIVKGGMYDLEYLYVARRKGARVEKVSIVPSPEIRPSRINVWRCLRQDPVDVLRVKAHGLFGRYH